MEPIRCHACEAREATAARWAKDDNATTHGMYFVVSPETYEEDAEP